MARNDLFLKLLLLLLIFTAIKTSGQPLPALIPYKTLQGFGYCDSNKVMRIKPQYEEAGFFANGKASVLITSSPRYIYAMIDEKGNYIIPPEYHWTGDATEDMSYAMLNVYNDENKWGLVDINGNLRIPFMYDSPDSKQGYDPQQFYYQRGYNNSIMIARKDGKQGIIDTNNNVLVPFIFDSIPRPNQYDTLTAFAGKKNGKFGVMNLQGKQQYPFEMDEPPTAQGKDWVIGKKNDKMGVIDANGKIIIPFEYALVQYQKLNTRKDLHYIQKMKKGITTSKDGTICALSFF